MASLNKVFLAGRLGADVELRTAGSQPVARLRLATDESYTDRNGQRVDRTEWHSVSVWGKQAEFCHKFLSKGSNVLVEGKLTTREWQDQNGNKRTATEIKAERVQFLDKREGSQRQERQPAPSEYGGMDEIPY